MKINLKKLFKTRGFSLIEVPVALYIISTGVLAAMALILQTINTGKINTSTVTAAALAQEGIELVRQKRDTNWLIGANWQTGILPAAADRNYTIYLDSTDGSIDVEYTVNDIASARLFLDANNFYTHANTTKQTPFYRLITISNDDANKMTVECVVQWQNGGKKLNYRAATVLYNWH
jgi:Tfp pilus assembly protein PilV